MLPATAEAAPTSPPRSGAAAPPAAKTGDGGAACGNARRAIEATQALAAVAAIVAELDPAALARTAAIEAAQLLDAERATLFLLDADGASLSAQPDPDRDGKPGQRLPRGRGLAWASLAAGMPLNVTQAYADLRFDPAHDRQTGQFTRSVLVAPIVSTSGPLGVLEVTNKSDGPFDAADEQCLSALCGAVAAGLDNARRFNDLQNVRRHSDSVLQSMSNGVMTLDGQGRIISCNAAALRLIRRRRGDVIGAAAARILQGTNGWILERARRVAATGVADVSMDAELCFAGRCLVVNVTVLPLNDCHTDAIGTLIVIEDTTAEKRVKAMMLRYMDPRLAGQLIESGADMLGGRSVRATVLFCDLRNSTKLAGDLGAQGTVSLLNEFFTLVDGCLRAEGGMLDKFIGDAVLAAFGIPVPGDGDEDRAVRAALAMIDALQRWNRARVASGLAAVEMGVGINTDIVVAGNIGSPKRMDYTVIGAGVNLAARLEKACKRYGTAILISGHTAQRLDGDYPMRPVDTIGIPGKVDPVDIYEIIDDRTARSFPDLQASLEVFSRGVRFRRKGQYDDAADCFHTCLSLNPADRAAAVQLDACRRPVSTTQDPPAEEMSSEPDPSILERPVSRIAP